MIRILATLLLLSPGYALAQTPVQLPADVFQAAIVAHGGAALNAINTVRIIGQSTSPSGSTAVQISANLDGRIRLDYGDALKPKRTVIQTPAGQMVITGEKVQYKPPHVDLFGQLDWLSVLGLRYLNVGFVDLTDRGPDTMADRATRVLRANNGVEQRHYGRVLANQLDIDLDAQTGLIARLRRQQHSDNSLDFTFTVSYSFADYRRVGPIVFPFRIEKAVNSRVVETIVVQDVQLNPIVLDSSFERQP
jgi:hypothetical protein